MLEGIPREAQWETIQATKRVHAWALLWAGPLLRSLLPRQADFPCPVVEMQFKKTTIQRLNLAIDLRELGTGSACVVFNVLGAGEEIQNTGKKTQA